MPPPNEMPKPPAFRKFEMPTQPKPSRQPKDSESGKDQENVRARRIHLPVGRGTLIADGVFRWGMLGCALSIIAIVVLILFELFSKSQLSITKFGFGFFIGKVWDPVAGEFGALPFLYGTIVS